MCPSLPAGEVASSCAYFDERLTCSLRSAMPVSRLASGTVIVIVVPSSAMLMSAVNKISHPLINRMRRSYDSGEETEVQAWRDSFGLGEE